MFPVSGLRHTLCYIILLRTCHTPLLFPPLHKHHPSSLPYLICPPNPYLSAGFPLQTNNFHPGKLGKELRDVKHGCGRMSGLFPAPPQISGNFEFPLRHVWHVLCQPFYWQ